MLLAQVHRNKLKPIKDNIEKSYNFFKTNIKRYHFFRKFVFETSLSQKDKKELMSQANPLQEKLNLEKTKLAAQIQQNQVTNAHKAIELGLDKENIDTDRIKLMADLQTSHNANLVQLEKAQTERLAREIDLAIKTTIK